MAKRNREIRFVKVDENILMDPDIEDLIEAGGFEAFGVYIGILSLLRTYAEYDYMIPVSRMKIIARKTFSMTENQLKKFVDLCISCRILLEFRSESGEVYIYSRRRREELLEQDKLKKKQQEGGKKGMEKRYEKHLYM